MAPPGRAWLTEDAGRGTLRGAGPAPGHSQGAPRAALTIPELCLFRMCSAGLPEQNLRAMPVRSAETETPADT